MKFHLSILTNINLHDFCSDLRRDLEKRKLSINRDYVDRRDSSKNRATLQQKSVQKIVHDERNLFVLSCENDVKRTIIHEIAWLCQSTAFFASHVNHFFAEIKNHFMCLLAASQARDFAQRLTELATSQRWSNDVLHSSWNNRLAEIFEENFWESSQMSKEIKKHVSFMSLELRSHFCLFHFTNYDIYWLMISLRSISK
jgi:uncharacterized membrane protein YheB (UPF0754 family)